MPRRKPVVPTVDATLRKYHSAGAALSWAGELAADSAPLRDALIARAWVEGMSTHQIAQDVGLTAGRVQQIAAREIGPLTPERREELQREWGYSQETYADKTP